MLRDLKHLIESLCNRKWCPLAVNTIMDFIYGQPNANGQPFGMGLSHQSVAPRINFWNEQLKMD